MAYYKEFLTNVRRYLPVNLTDNICKITTTTLNDVFDQSQLYFNVPLENLKFEIITVRDGSLLQEPQYVVISYPSQEYSFIDEGSQVIKNIHGEFFVRKGKGIVYLMVTPPEKGGQQVLPNLVFNLINKLHVLIDINKNLIKKIVDDSKEQWVVIGEFEYDETDDANISVDVGKDKMSASILLKKSGMHGSDITANQIYKELQYNDVKFGIKNAVIDRLEKRSIYNQWIEVATGIPVEHGNNSSIEVLGKHENEANKVESRNPIDAKLRTVYQGNVVAKKVLYSEGKDGRNVLGDAVFSNVGSDITMLGNDNVSISEDGLEATALVDGSVFVKGNKVFVDCLWVIKSDLTLGIGDIDFPGSVIIQGSVGDDFNIKVEGNLAIRGSIGNSNVKVGGNLHVGRGIHGRGESIIDVGGNLVTKFIETAQVKVKNICFVEDSVINSNILSLNKVVVIKGKGRISSSIITAEKQIIARNIGSVLGGNTELRVMSFRKREKKLVDIHQRINVIKKK